MLFNWIIPQLTVNIKLYTLKKKKSFPNMTKENFLPNAHCVWEDRWEVCGSSVYFGDFSFLWHLCQLLLRAFRRAGEKGDAPLSGKRKRRWWAQQLTCFGLQVGSKDMHNLRLSLLSDSILLLARGNQWFLFPSGAETVLFCECANQRYQSETQNLCDTGHMPSVNFSSLLWHETSLLNMEQW